MIIFRKRAKEKIEIRANKRTGTVGDFGSQIKSCCIGTARTGLSAPRMKLLLLLGSVLMMLLMGSLSAQAQTVCVRSGAIGTNDGSDWINAYTSLPATLQRGAIYYIADGIYNEYTFDDPEQAGQYITIKKATVANHGTETGWNSGYGDGVATFTGSIAVTTGYVDFDGVTGGRPGNWKIGHGFEFTSVAGTNITYFNITPGISNVWIHHVYFNQTGDTTLYTVGAHAIYNPGALSNSLVEYCYFDNLGGLPLFLRNGSGNIFQYNYFGDICGISVADFNQHCEAVVIHDMDDVHFRWNYVSECPSSGGFVKNNVQTADLIRIYGNVFTDGFPINCNSGPCTNWKIFNNTFASFGGGPFGGDGAISGLYYYNNIAYSSTYVGPLRSTHDYNWYSNISGVRCTMNANTHENICVDCAAGCDSISETLDPFVNSAGDIPEDFRLTTAIDGWPGYNVCLLDDYIGEDKYNIDAFGNTRGADGTWDRGAFEYAGPVKKPAAVNLYLSP